MALLTEAPIRNAATMTTIRAMTLKMTKDVSMGFLFEKARANVVIVGLGTTPYAGYIGNTMGVMNRLAARIIKFMGSPIFVKSINL